jgi:hypothetical protein
MSVNAGGSGNTFFGKQDYPANGPQIAITPDNGEGNWAGTPADPVPDPNILDAPAASSYADEAGPENYSGS